MKKYLCIIQARMGSTRLPGKMLFKLGKVTMLEYLLERIKYAKKIDKVIVATGNATPNRKIKKICQKAGVECFMGLEDDVLDRYYQCSLKNPQYNYIIRLTGDNPLIDPYVIDQMIEFSKKNPHYDYISNNLVRTFPYGLDFEIFKREALAEAANKASYASEREHVTLYMRNNDRFKKGNYASPFDFSQFRLTVDHKEDFEVIEFLAKNAEIGDNYIKYISLLLKNPHIMEKNMHIAKDEGMKKSLDNDFKVK